ncbi:MAG: bifunctional DedA family/phosphatase PAP2 family protein [Marinobacter sp.]|nr:bifunctional DedA family/phosphatase PAP2 family protein [Marinobacter sp.]
MMDWLHQLADFLAQEPAWISGAIFAIAMAESLVVVGLILPGVVMLSAVTALAAKAGIPLGEVLIWAAAGAIVGDALSYWLGRILGYRINGLWPFSRHPALLSRGEHFFRDHGGKSVVIGRFIGPLRPIIPVVAGAFGMSQRRFFSFNILSAIGWAPVYIIPGYAVGSALSRDVNFPPELLPVLVVSLLVLIAMYTLFFRFHWEMDRDSQFYSRLQRVMSRYPVGKRLWLALSNQRPDGREFPLASLTLGIASTALVVLWSLFVAVSKTLREADLYATELFQAVRQPLLDPVFQGISMAADLPALVPAFGLLVLLLAFRGYYAAALHVTIAGLLALITTEGLKTLLAVPRPELTLLAPESYAYPSGHTVGITVLVGLIASLIAAELPHRKRWRVYTALTAPVVVVAFSRLYLGVHWFSDIVGGLLIGMAICGLTRAGFSRYDRQPIQPEWTTYLALAGWLLLTLVVIWLRWDIATLRYTPL